MNKDALLKHHFWGLAALAPLLVVVSVLLISSDVGSAVEKSKKEYDGKLKEVNAASPKGKGILTVLEQQKEVVLEQRKRFWDDNWKRQTGQLPDSRVNLFEWPADPTPQQALANLAKTDPKFGAELKGEAARAAFETLKQQDVVYEAAYNKVAAGLLPTSFPNRDWRTALRYVQWGVPVPTGNQVWLALEDFWVQRALLQPVKDLNAAAARFDLVRDAGGDPPPLTRTFRSRVWQVELKIPTDGPNRQRVIEGKLTNLTDRLQVLGTPALRLNVWLSTIPTAQPVPFRVEGDFVKAGETLNIKYVRGQHDIPAGTDVQVINRVEQVYDDRTVPVRQVQTVALGYLDNRHAGAVLKAPAFLGDDAATAPKIPGAPGVPPPPGSSGSETVYPTGMPPGYPGSVAPGAAAGGLKGGPPAVVLDGNKKRYLETSPQVRRMPVALTLVVDQLFMEDALIAYANSPLRFQTCQTHWKRFRGALPPPPAGGTAELAAGVPPPYPTGGPGYPSEAQPGYPGARPPGVFSSGAPGSSSPPYPSSSAESGSPGYPGYPGSGSSGAATRPADDGQAVAGLVEVTLYGIVTLYERYEDPKAADATADAKK